MADGRRNSRRNRQTDCRREIPSHQRPGRLGHIREKAIRYPPARDGAPFLSHHHRVTDLPVPGTRLIDLSSPAPISPKSRGPRRSACRIPSANAPGLSAGAQPRPGVGRWQRVIAEEVDDGWHAPDSRGECVPHPAKGARLTDTELFCNFPFWSIFRPRGLFRMSSPTVFPGGAKSSSCFDPLCVQVVWTGVVVLRQA